MKSLLFLLFLSVFSLGLMNPAAAAIASLPVPFISEVPDGAWVAPWNNACEEASIAMVEQYYLGKTSVSRENSKILMYPLFKIEDEIFGSSQDTSAGRTQILIRDHTKFTATVKEKPTLEEIKAEINQGRPVITTHYGFGLNNSELRFRRGGSSYHMMVVKGYDDEKRQFIVNDPGNDKNGLDFRYDYDIFLNSLHDFNHNTGKADGPARVLFTDFDVLVKSTNNSAVYLIKDGSRHYITHPDLFKANGWKWSAVQTWPDAKLEILPIGNPIELPQTEEIVKSANRHPIYLIRDGIRHYITHPRLFKVYGWLWSAIKIWPQEKIDAIPEGSPIVN